MVKIGRKAGVIIAALVVIAAAIIIFAIYKQKEVVPPVTPPKSQLTLADYPEVFKKDVIIVIGENASQIEIEGARMIADNLGNLTGNVPVIKTDVEITEDEKVGYNLILVGRPDANSLLREVYERTNATKVTYDYPGVGKGVLEILHNPWNEEKAMLLVAGSDEWGVKAGAKIIIERGGRVQDKIFITNWIDLSSEVIIEIPQNIKLKALEAYSSSNDRISIPKNLYIESYPPDMAGYYLVQFRTVIYEEYKEKVSSIGGLFYGSIPGNAFIVKMNESTKNKVQNLEIIRWVGIYQPAYRISPNIIAEQKIADRIPVTISLFDVDENDVSSQIKVLGGEIISVNQNYIQASIDSSAIPKIASINGVMWIAKYTEPVFIGDN